MHITIQPGGFNADTGVRLAQAYVQKFTPAEFKASSESRSFAGKEIEILHDATVSEVDTDTSDPSATDNPNLKSLAPDNKRNYSTPLASARRYFEDLTGKKAPEEWGQVKLSDAIEEAQRQANLAGNNLFSADVNKVSQMNNGISSATPEQLAKLDEAKKTVQGNDAAVYAEVVRDNTDSHREDDGTPIKDDGTPSTPNPEAAQSKSDDSQEATPTGESTAQKPENKQAATTTPSVPDTRATTATTNQASSTSLPAANANKAPDEPVAGAAAAKQTQGAAAPKPAVAPKPAAPTGTTGTEAPKA